MHNPVTHLYAESSWPCGHSELLFNQEIAGSNPGQRFLFLFYIQMFFYTIMKLFITLLENVKKSRTSTGSLSLINIDKEDQNKSN
jgi:hypothetical protein